MKKSVFWCIVTYMLLGMVAGAMFYWMFYNGYDCYLAHYMDFSKYWIGIILTLLSVVLTGGMGFNTWITEEMD